MAVNTLTGLSNITGLPDEIVSNILFQSSTPTFVQLTRTSKEFYNCAKNDRELLLHHLGQIPGTKENLGDRCRDNSALFQLLRQRATNNLYGINFTANVTEYLARHAKLNLGASCISGLDADYVRHALCFEHSVDIRQYTSNCLVKERISQQPNTKILKTVQLGRYLSVLCAFTNDEVEAEVFPDEHESDHYDSNSESDAETEERIRIVDQTAAFAPSVNALLESKIKYQPASRIPGKRKPPSKVRGYKYRICHYDIYTLEDSATFIIDDQPGLIPRDFIVQSCLFCAVLWDKDNKNGRPTNSAKIIVYTARESQTYYAPKYDEQTVWPRRSKPCRMPNNHSDDEDEFTESPPEKIAFFRDGKRIKMYNAGGIVPYKVFSSFAADDERSYVSSNIVHYGGLDSIDFYVDTPFYGMHGRYYEEHTQQDYCYQTYLCLGKSKLSLGESNGNAREANVLCILRSQTKMDPEGCEHKTSLQRMAHLSAQSSSIVARLWGWEEMHTTLTGKEAVAVSSGGTRIAIAMWDKVLIYAVNPKVLCEETVVDSSDEEGEKSKKKKRKSRKTWEYPATQYYHRIKDVNLLDMNIAQLKPVVLDLGGAIAHRMHWSPAKGKITDTALTVDEEVIPEPEVEQNMDQKEEIGSVSSSSDTGSDTATPESDLGTSQIQSSEVGSAEDSISVQDTPEFPALTMPIVETGENEQPAGLDAEDSQHLSRTCETVPASTSEAATVKSEARVSSTEESPSINPLAIAKHDTLNTTTSGPALSEINTNVTPLPMSLVPSVGHASQGTKISARKKEKSPEVGYENAIAHTLTKDKIMSGFTVIEHPKQKNGPTVSVPSSPIISKAYPKPKQTVAEALAVENYPSPLLANFTPESGMKALPTTPAGVSEVEETDQADTEETGGTASHSKTAVAETTAEQAGHSRAAVADDLPPQEPPPGEPQEEAAQEREALPKRRKRVTEDELIILTDRGIQIWNLGPRAKGIRPRPRSLPMEEGLAGRVPLLKQSQSSSKQTETNETAAAE